MGVTARRGTKLRVINFVAHGYSLGEITPINSKEYYLKYNGNTGLQLNKKVIFTANKTDNNKVV